MAARIYAAPELHTDLVNFLLTMLVVFVRAPGYNS